MLRGRQTARNYQPTIFGSQATRLSRTELIKVGINMEQCDFVYSRNGECVLKPAFVEVQAAIWEVKQIHHTANAQLVYGASAFPDLRFGAVLFSRCR
jgi:hypothetical protein